MYVDDWFTIFQHIVFNIALVRARLNELRKAEIHCPESEYVRERVRELEDELQHLKDELEKLRPSRGGD